MADEHHLPSANRLAQQTIDINQFLIDEIKPMASAGDHNMSRTVTYHDPCHLKKSLNVFNQPRAIINAAAGYELKEMAESDWCCGMGGSFNLQYYDISKGIGMKKAAQIKRTGADVLATGCPACMIQISDMLSQADATIAVRHPIELLAETLDR